MQTILDQSKKTLGELDKIKKDVRSVKTEKVNLKRAGSCSDNDDFRRRAISSIQFIEDNLGQLKSLLHGERDACPTDLGKFLLKSRS